MNFPFQPSPPLTYCFTNGFLCSTNGWAGPSSKIRHNRTDSSSGITHSCCQTELREGGDGLAVRRENRGNSYTTVQIKFMVKSCIFRDGFVCIPQYYKPCPLKLSLIPLAKKQAWMSLPEAIFSSTFTFMFYV